MGKSRWKRIAFEVAERLKVLDLIQGSDPKRGQFLYTLAYHRVEELTRNPYLDPHEISATPQQFFEQMRLVASRYHPVTAEEVRDAYSGMKPMPSDAVLVTVDDGYRDSLDVIYPICSELGIKPVLFVATSFVGSGIFWWDKVYQLIYFSGRDTIETPIGILPMRDQSERSNSYQKLLHELKFLPSKQVFEWIDQVHTNYVKLPDDNLCFTLNWDELRYLQQNGCTIASHSHTHPILAQISLDEVVNEVRQSNRIIRKELGEVVPMFAIPDGKQHAFTQEIIQIIHAEGFDLVFHMMDGRAMIRPQSPNLAIPRISVWQSLTFPHFHMRLTPLIDKTGNWKKWNK